VKDFLFTGNDIFVARGYTVPSMTLGNKSNEDVKIIGIWEVKSFGLFLHKQPRFPGKCFLHLNHHYILQTEAPVPPKQWYLSQVITSQTTVT
jgi:hypothetical protein